MAVEENEVPNIPQAMFNNLPWVAGKYLVKVSILDTNLENESDCFITYTINRVSSLGSSYLKAEFPNLNWTSATSGYHLNYLQPLKAISIATNQDTEVLYSHHYMDLGKVKYRWEQISGRFLVAYSLYTGDFSTQSVADFVYEQEEYDELNVGAHSLYLYFVPSNENLTNFNLIYIAYNVNVGKAQPIFYDIVATPITYGKTINSIDDVNLSKDAAAQKAVKFKLYEDQNGTHYHYMSEEEYTYSLYTVANPLLPAGINNIIITFRPVDNVNYEQANGTVAVVVNKRVVDISFEKNARYDEANDIYIYPYRAYVNAAPLLNAEQLVKSTDDPQGSYAVFEYDETNVSGGYKGASYTSSILATGKYRIDYTINDPNYSGSNYYYVEITKDSLRRSADPLISLAATAVSYGKLMSAVSFIGGSMISSSSNAKIEGTYYLNYPAGTVFQVMGQQNLKLKFVPNDTENYLVYEGDSNGDYNINVFVSRADISAELTLEVRNDYTYGDLAHDWNFTDTSYTSNIFTNGVNFASSKLDESYRYIDGTYSINSRPMTGYFNAGTYNVTFTVNEDPTFQKYYTGSVTVPLTIAKKKAVMAVENNVKVFNNKAQGLDVAVFLAQIDGENVTPGVRLSESVVQTFYKNGVKMNARPSAIGLYTVEITLQSINYEYYYAEKLQSEFTIKVDSDQIVITNLNQLYSVQRAIGISLGINSAVYTIKYYDINTLTEYSNLPINSGMYEVKLIFDSASNNGYEETIVYKDLLIIDKYTANIITSNVVSTLYSGKSNIISVRTEPYNLQFITTYRKQGETEFTLDEAINANTGNGYHEVKFVIDNNNYKGEKIIRYYILPSTLTVESHPTFNNYVYNTDIQPEINSRGIVRFGYDEIIENGVYEIPLGNIKYLDVGTYNVGYNFIAYNQFGEVDTNYQMASGVCKVVITKQNIDSANIIISDDIPLSVNYNTGYHYVYANLCKGLGQCDCSAHYDASNIDKDGLIYNIYSNNKDFSIRIKYNNSSTPALSLGEYTISAEIVSKNYTGNVVFDKKLIVFKGTPEIRVKPSIKESVSLNIVYDGTNYVYPTVSTNDIKAGEAFIQDTQIRISGTFTVIEGQNLTRANINHLNVLFTPFDTNFNPSTIIIDVNVMGVNPLSGISNDKNADWTDVSITSNIEESYQSVTIAARPIASSNYGAQLQDFELYFANESDGTENNYYSDFGYLSFINPLYVPNVGEKVSVKFTPYDSQNQLYGYVYNEMKGMLSLPLTKADMAESVSFYLKGFENKALATDMVFEIIDGDSILSIYDGAFTIYTDETKTELFDMDSPIFYENVVNNQVYIVYTSNNYNDVEFYTTIEVYNRINESDINIMYLSKEYSEDTGIVISDLSPQVNLAGNISQEYMQLIITDSNGDISEGKEIGIYRITLIIDNGEYYGTKEISDFSVVRKDISEDIQLSELSSDYGDFEEPTVLYNGGTLDIDYYTLMYKISTAPDTSYSRNITEDANSYNVHINIDTYNYFASKVFTYVIKPIKVRVFAMNKEVTYASLDVNDAPEVSFKLLNSEEALTLKYTLYYYNDNYTITTQKPSDVGAYKVKMIIDDTNYVPDANDTYVEFNYTITQATVIITTVPSVLSTMAEDGSVYNIKYGQALSDVKIIGGEARRNNVPVAGSFSVGNSAVRPSAGSYIMTIVFTPYNSNYASAEVNSQITVARGDAQVIVDNLYAKYDGISKKNWIQVTVQPSGVQVAISYTNSKGNVIAEPTNAGTYYINATSLNNNYNVTISRSADGSMTPRLVIVKAKVQTIDNGYNVNNPNALNIMAGDSLAKSSLTGGEVYYEGFTNAVQGKFTYLQSALIFDTAGVHTTGYIFTPDDINNFDTYQGIIEITVNKAYATITVTNTDFVYGEGFTMPKFTTNPIGLSYEHNITFTEYDPSGAYNSFDVIPAGTYEFEVWITSPNYARDDNNLVFFIHIAKKEIDIDFINENGDVVTQYKTTYGVPLETAIKLYSQNNNQGKRGYLLKDEIVNDVIISERKTTRYVSTDKGVYYDSQVVPKERGGYEVTVSLRNDNYTASRTVTYVIERGFIEEIFFDTNTLENVGYGDVKVPIIYTRPSDISYYIVYHGHGTTRPKDAGSYDITVYFDDDNYEKKQVTAMFKINPLKISINQITVKDKVYDGVSGLEINGKLNGVRLGDEVDLVLKATTLDDDVSVGAHYVDITEYSLKGKHAKNYIVEKPIYYGQVNIFTKVISANSSKSYITSSTGFRAGTTVEIVEIDDKNNKTNIFTKAIGVESTVIGYSLKENGKETSINEPIKVYIAIPKQYLNTDFVVKPADKLSGQTISFRREGNYITFDTTSSGSVAFEKTEFKYGFAVTVISVVVIIIGIFVLFVLNPVHRKSKTSDRTMEKRVIKRIRRGY
ncbi:MAG TPA: MBG domain-containing protein [Clostridia bacterium]|nr:MBG domain-containing protein [Clostridia bacterium]